MWLQWGKGAGERWERRAERRLEDTTERTLGLLGGLCADSQKDMIYSKFLKAHSGHCVENRLGEGGAHCKNS